VLLANGFERCVNEALAQNRLSRDVAQAILDSDDPNQAIDDVLGNLTRQKRETAIQAVRISQAYDSVKSHPQGMSAGITALLTKDPRGNAKYKNVEFLAKYYEGKFHSMNAEALAKFRSRMFGIEQDEEELAKFLKAIYREDVDDPEIKAMADAWHETAEQMRVLFNARGGSISKNERWLMPQRHDQASIKKAGVETWKETIRDLLDREFMVDEAGRPLSDEQFEEALDAVYETISTGGLNKAKGLTVPRLGKKLSRKGGEKRFLYFKDADSWMKYQNRFGRGNVFDALTDYINMMSNDIAVMETLGPSPHNTFDFLINKAKLEEDLTGPQEAFNNAVFKVAAGQVNGGELTSAADALEATRNVLTSVTLGGAFISALSDSGFVAMTAKMNGIAPLKVIRQQMALMRPDNEADRIFGTRLGLTAENAARQTAANRYADTYGTGKAAKLAEGVMRASGLEAWTNAARKAFGMEFSALLADNFQKSFANLETGLQDAFARYGITEQDWDGFRKQPPLMLRGAPYADMTQEGGVKFHQMVLSETDFAVPTPDARVRAVTTMGTSRATVSGMGIRTVMQLKSFPITILMGHGMRMFYQDTAGKKLQYFGGLMAITTILGGITLQAKDLAAGREPRPMLDNDGVLKPEFVVAAMAQGGGLGIFGDFLFSDQNRFGSGPASTLLGPTGDLVNRAARLSIGNIQEAIRGEETHIFSETIDFAERYTPDIWQIQTAKNAMFDQLELMADPDAQRKYNRIMRNRMRDYDQGYWWEPGEPLPEAFK
jgi:hypothetical protein